MAKWFQCMKVVWSNLMVYKTNFILQSISPLFVFLFIKASLWTAIYKGAERVEIGGYDLNQMLTYHLWIMVVTLISIGAISQDLSQDIRLGRITAYLIYPFSLFEFHFSGFLARQSVKLAIALFTLFGVVLALKLPLSVTSGGWAILLALWAGLFWFFLNYFFGLLGFWLEETWTLGVMSQVITYFLSGAIIPLELYPLWMQKILFFTPFPYIGFVPVKLIMGSEVALAQAFAVLTLWIAFIALCGYGLYKRGLRLYTAAGM